MSYKVLTKEQVEQFMELGWVKLEQAYSEQDALAAQDVVWEKLESRGVSKNDRSTWTQAMVHMRENYDTPEFRRCKTQRMTDAIEDLIGRGRWAMRDEPIRWGWWPVNFFSGADQPWDVPTLKWHVDGIHHPQYLHSKEQGLLLLCLFSEIKPRGGGTLVAEGSHKVIANILARHPEGLDVKDVNRLPNEHPWFAKLTGAAPMGENENRIDYFMNRTYTDDNGFTLKVTETTGAPGDIIIGHPFLYHAASSNHSGIPRFMCNNQGPLIDDITLERSNADEYTPLEISIRSAIGSGGIPNERH
jgi:hypothetical protein